MFPLFDKFFLLRAIQDVVKGLHKFADIVKCNV